MNSLITPKLHVFLLLFCSELVLKCFTAPFPLREKSDVCGTTDWKPYGLEKCYKFILNEDQSSLKLLSYANAESHCFQEDQESTLPSISSEDEGHFLLDLINGTETDMWLGGKISNSTFKWTDKSQAHFSNWLHQGILDKGTERSCIQLSTDLDSRGKWTLGHCTHKSNYVICQKRQEWEPSAIQTILLNTRLEIMTEMASFKSKLDLSRLQVIQNEMKMEISSLRQQVRNEITQAAQSMSDKMLTSTIPPGFIYVQYGNQVDPTVLWPSLSWRDVSGQYSGQFFRAVGGNSASFGIPQTGNAPHIVRASHEWLWRQQRPNENFQGDVLIRPGETSEPLRTGRSHSVSGPGFGSVYGIRFTMSGGEIRPYNSAVKIWMRV